jgi:glycosyltransferase involved in cell wall biosynthesis
MTATKDQHDGAELEAAPLISVVICCHNSAKRLPETLLHLSRQKVPRELMWEIVVVDNASTDETVAAARRFADQHPGLQVRIVRELELGQTFARLRGLREMRGKIVLFVDDDNWLDPEYVAMVGDAFLAHPEISALGGMSTAVYEQNPPAWMSRHQRWYAVSGVPESSDELNEVEFLWGAGTAFRRAALEDVVSKPLRITGRRGTALQAGDDNELCCRLRARGERLFCHSGLRFRHFLPQQRVQWNYLRRLHRAAGEISVLLDAYRFSSATSDNRSRPTPQWLLRSWHAQVMNVWLQLLRHPVVLWRSSRSAMENDDTVLRVESYQGRLAALRRHRGDYRRIVGGECDE